jgi:hypothetical protein
MHNLWQAGDLLLSQFHRLPAARRQRMEAYHVADSGSVSGGWRRLPRSETIRAFTRSVWPTILPCRGGQRVI